MHRAVHAVWARDIPQEAYRDAYGVEGTLVTPASAAHLYCMRQAKGKLDAIHGQLVKPVSSG